MHLLGGDVMSAMIRPDHSHTGGTEGGGTDSREHRATAYGVETDAIVLHCPGPLRDPEHPMHREWELAQSTFFADHNYRGSAQNDLRLKIITYNTKSETSLLESCAAHLGVDLVVLGAGISDWCWEYKIILVHDYLKKNHESELVLCVDAFDTLLLGAPSEIVSRFLSTESTILFASTGSDWPPSQVHRRFEEKAAGLHSPEHRHLNASYIGITSEVVDCLSTIRQAIQQNSPWCRTVDGFDDQLAWRELHRRRYPRLKIDHKCVVFARFDKFR